MEREDRDDRFVAVEDEYAGYTVYDMHYEKIGQVEDLFVVEKRPVVKEEIRLRKDVVEDEEVVEEDGRKEEVEIDDQTTHRDE